MLDILAYLTLSLLTEVLPSLFILFSVSFVQHPSPFSWNYGSYSHLLYVLQLCRLLRKRLLAYSYILEPLGSAMILHPLQWNSTSQGVLR
ncbi:hypothetical protein BDQ17DRAFT_654087 [Cyathus striatus]|nr:hypothetical protein BDQ17DRAFT_654087 [Cyathus striatus]